MMLVFRARYENDAADQCASRAAETLGAGREKGSPGEPAKRKAATLKLFREPHFCLNDTTRLLSGLLPAGFGRGEVFENIDRN